MKQEIKLLDVVALRSDLPELGLYRGQVGTVVEEYEPAVFEVEFSDSSGRAYALETLRALTVDAVTPRAGCGKNLG
ncbi:MAG: DUF4926 domain-containing protein [Oscillatoria sp. Prado101]|jgi:hypothetical protein|nr:DUF4926 domain-containing protein [Oscillatoria sp. Prado101]